jgi:hypothetical protein
MDAEIDELTRLGALTSLPAVRHRLENICAEILRERDEEKKKKLNEGGESLTYDPAPAPNAPALKGEENRISRPSEISYSTVGGLEEFTGIEKFSWVDERYNNPWVTLYIPLTGVGQLKDTVKCHFGKNSFDLQVTSSDGQNFRLVKDTLAKDILPEECKYIVKKDKVVLKLRKMKGEYGYDSWTSLVAKTSAKV